MSIEARPTKTAAEESLARSFAAARDKLPGGSAVQVQRGAAFRRFETTGLPHRRIEQWKYTDLRAVMREAKPLAGPPGAALKKSADQAGTAFAATTARRLVFADGAFVAELSDLSALEPGLTITMLSDALARGMPTVMTRVSEAGPADADLAFSLNTAFMGDGAVIDVAPGAKIARPIHLIFVCGRDKASASFTRSLLKIGAGAHVMLLESHDGPDSLDYQTNSALDVHVGEEAVFEHVKVGLEGSKALHISTLIATLAKNAQFHDVVLAAGGALVRNQFFVTCAGTGATIDLRGASLLAGTQHADTTLVLDHAVSGCQSRELFKSVLDGEARSVFQGKIVVRPNAQKTDARMMTQALLLSEQAEADAKPELEIFADDVQCGHGATAGALDDKVKFYLTARGIPAKEAEALLIEGFVGEVVDGVAHEAVQAALRDVLAAKLAARG